MKLNKMLPITSSVLLAATLALAGIGQGFGASADLSNQIQSAVTSATSQYKKDLDALKAELNNRIDEGHLGDVEVFMEFDVEWDITSVSFDVPSAKMVTKRWTFDTPSSLMVYKSCIMKIPEIYNVYKIRMRCVGMDVPEFFMERQEVKLDIPEFFMNRVEWKFHFPKITSADNTIKHKQNLGREYEKRFNDLAIQQAVTVRTYVAHVFDTAIARLTMEIETISMEVQNVAALKAEVAVIKAQKVAFISRMNATIQALHNKKA